MDYIVSNNIVTTVSTGIINAQIPFDVTAIGAEAFKPSSNTLETVVFLGSSVERILSRAFMDCVNLVSVGLENCTSLYLIGNRAFANCFKLSSIFIPESVSIFEGNCFRLCNLKQTINLASIVTQFSGSCFTGTRCSFICAQANENFCDLYGNIYNKTQEVLIAVSFSNTDLRLPPLTTTIANSAFSSSNLTEICIPETVVSLLQWALCFANSTKSLLIPGSIATLIQNSIMIMPVIERITFTEGLMTLDNGCIIDCPMLRSIAFPSTLINISVDSIQLCPQIEYVSYFDTALISKYHLAGIPLRALIRPFNQTCSFSVYLFFTHYLFLVQILINC